jgi:hypothetical protein
MDCTLEFYMHRLSPSIQGQACCWPACVASCSTVFSDRIAESATAPAYQRISAPISFFFSQFSTTHRAVFTERFPPPADKRRVCCVPLVL